MTKHTINLEGAFNVSKGPRDGSWRAAVSIDLGALSPDIVARLIEHGLKQKVADAASGATTEAEAVAAMQQAADAILAGDWTSRRAGEGVDEETSVGRMVARNALKTSWGAKSEKWAAFTGLSDDEQATKLDTVRADNAALFAPAIAGEIAARKAKRDSKAALGKSVTINL